MQTLIIEAGRTERHYWKDLWRYRELFYFLAWRDLLVRYKQTVIGVVWSVLRPFLTMVVFTLVFSKLAKLPSAVIPVIKAVILLSVVIVNEVVSALPDLVRSYSNATGPDVGRIRQLTNACFSLAASGDTGAPADNLAATSTLTH